MAVPTNLDALTATDIPTFPASISQSVVDAGVTYTVWYKFTAPVDAVVFGIWGFGGNVGSGYQPTAKPYNGPAAAPVWIGIAAQNKPFQMSVVAGEEYFLEFVKNGNNTPSVLTLSVQVHSPVTVPIGSIYINDDAPGFPGAIMSSINADNYNVLKFINDTYVGEQADVLPTGEYLMHDDFNSPYNFKLYSGALTYVMDVAGFTGLAHPGAAKLRSCNAGSCWYAGYSGIGIDNAIIKRISNVGVIGATNYTLNAPGLTCLAVDNAETIIYYSGKTTSSDTAIRRWDIATNLVLANLTVTLGGNYISTDMLMLGDDSIVFLYFDAVSGDVTIKNINRTTGAIIHTYSLGAAFETSILPRLAYAIDDPLSFWVYLHPSGVNQGKTYVRNILVSSGATVSQVTNVEFESGVYNAPETATPLARFGSSFSCPLVILRTASVPANEGSGIYQLVPGKTFDELYVVGDVNIPDPTFKTALLGD